MGRTWGWFALLVVSSVLLTTDAAAQISECPFPYTNSPCLGVCDDGGSDIICDGGDYADAFFASGDTTNGPFIWGLLGQAVGKPRLFCCDQSNVGSMKRLWIRAEDGDDRIQLFFGDIGVWEEDSYLVGGQGSDTIVASPDTDHLDTIHGDEASDPWTGGADNLMGHYGSDLIYGGPGDDLINGGPHLDYYEDEIHGGAGSDTIDGTHGSDSLYGCDDVNSAFTCGGLDGADTINGWDGVDTIIGGKGGDTIDGGAGNDTIYGDYTPAYPGTSPGPDIIDGGDHDDVIYSGNSGSDQIHGNGGSDTIVVEGYFISAWGDDGDDVIDASSATGLAQLFGGEENDVITGSEYDDMIRGEGGDDHLYGNGGAEDCEGGAGDDCFCGGDGLDFSTSDGGAEDYGDIMRDSECIAHGSCLGNDWEFTEGPGLSGCSCDDWPPS